MTEDDYQHAQCVWDALGCQTLKDYMIADLLVAMGLFTDIMKNWRKVLHEIYGLDLTHYVSLPGYAFDSFLKSTNAKIEQPYNPELYTLVKSNVRGGFTTWCSRK